MNRLPDHLKHASTARTDAAAKRARAGLKKLVDARRPINFTAVAREAGVSTDFLYRHAELRTLIERHRTKTTGQPPQQPPSDQEPAAGSTSAAVRALARKVEEMRTAHRTEVTELRKALEAAQGENLELRRKLAAYTD